MKLQPTWFFIWMASISLGACGSRGTDTGVKIATDSPVVPTTELSSDEGDEQQKDFLMKIREISATSTTEEFPPPSPIETLDDEQRRSLLARLEPMLPETSAGKEFSFRPESPHPPRPGKTVEKAFSQNEISDSPQEDSSEFKVIRFAPEGSVDIAPHLFVTFSKPITAITDVNSAVSEVPVKISPMPEGSWRALGTKTLVFTPKLRFPMASMFDVEVPAGTKSAAGDTLKSKTSFFFRTPPLQIEYSYPSTSEPQDVLPVIFIRFNQQIDIDQVVKSIAVLSDKKEVSFEIVKEKDLPQKTHDNTDLKALAENALPNTWIAFRPKEPLPHETLIKVVLKKGAASAEGPLKTKKTQEFAFRTYAPLKMTENKCGWDRQCPPNADWLIYFNNPLDIESLDPASIIVEPALSDIKVNAWYKTLQISGQKRGRTSYKVTIPSTLKDSFGQSLEKTASVKFSVGPSEKQLFGFQQDIITLDPSASYKIPIHSINLDALKVEIHRVEPADYQKIHRDFEIRNKKRDLNVQHIALPGKKLFDDIIEVTGTPDELNKTVIDLAPYLKEGTGQFLLRVRPEKMNDLPHFNTDGVMVWVQVTNIGITAFIDRTELAVWTNALDEARPLRQASVKLLTKNGVIASVSDRNGLSRIDLPTADNMGEILVVEDGKDTAILPYSQSIRWGGGGWRKVVEQDSLRFFTFVDRKMYRPGETAKIKGWFRKIAAKDNRLSMPSPMPAGISWRVKCSKDNEIARGESEVSDLGGFDFSIPLPSDMNLGNAFISITAKNTKGLTDTEHYHSINVQEFRRPEFEVTTTAEPGPFTAHDEATVSVRASYYSGGALPFAPVNWTAIASPAFYSPPGHHDFKFGPWNPWWSPWISDETTERKTFSSKTDAGGSHSISVLFGTVSPPHPMSVSVEGTVTDVNQQAWTNSKKLLVHPSKRYIGLRLKSSYLGKNESVNSEIIVTDIEGKILSDIPVSLTMSRIDYLYKKSKYEETFVDDASCEIVSTQKPVSCALKPSSPGAYRIRASVKDDKGRVNVTDSRIWVEGAELPKAEFLRQEQVQIIPEKQSYQPGETASFMVQSPMYPAEGILTVTNKGIVEKQTFRMESPTQMLSVRVTEEMIPEFSVQVEIVGSRARNNAVRKQPAFASGTLTFLVPPFSRTLEVKISAQDSAVTPGGKTKLSLQVKDSKGVPVEGAETAIAVVDESILALTAYTLPDPISIFYAASRERLSIIHSRTQIQTLDPENISNDFAGGGGITETVETSAPSAMRASVPLSGQFGMRDSRMIKDSPFPPPKIAARINFDSLALFAPMVKTDKNGRAEIDLKLPDSLTRYRITAVSAAEDKYFGAGETNITARLPLMVRPSPPRFLNFGDTFEFPVVVQNQTDKPMDVEAAMRTNDVISLKNGKEAGVRLRVQPGDRAEARFKASAVKVGKASFQIAVSAGDFADAQTVSLPVRTPATTEAFATYGEIDDGAVLEKVQIPDNIWKQFGGLEVTTSSTELSALTDAFIYLLNYPFECSEQLASGVIAISSLKDVLSAFSVGDVPKPAVLAESVNKDIKELEKIQNANGGFGFWYRNEPSLPYISVHAAHSLAVAKEHGFSISTDMWNRSAEYLSNIDNNIPRWYDKDTVLFIQGYAVYVLDKMKQNPIDMAVSMVEKNGVEKIPLEAAAWILPVLHKDKKTKLVSQIIRRFENNATETASGAHFVTSYSDGEQVLLHSDRRADAVLLSSLIDVASKHDLIPKLVRGLLAHKTQGRWNGTQENAFVLTALEKYFKTFEKTVPNFTAGVWLNDKLAFDYQFKGRNVDRAHAEIPMTAIDNRNNDITVNKDGKGRLYYRLGMQYASKDLSQKPADFGFTLERSYEAIDDANDVTRDKDGTWRIRRGAKVRVRVSMVSTMRRYHVALIDNLPAGLEAINPLLAVEGSVPEDPNEHKAPYWQWNRPWFVHQNLRDDRAEAFTSLLWEGVHDYTYLARASTPGTYIVPPARAEEMYSPETFGRTGTDKVVIK